MTGEISDKKSDPMMYLVAYSTSSEEHMLYIQAIEINMKNLAAPRFKFRPKIIELGSLESYILIESIPGDFTLFGTLSRIMYQASLTLTEEDLLAYAVWDYLRVFFPVTGTINSMFMSSDQKSVFGTMTVTEKGSRKGFFIPSNTGVTETTYKLLDADTEA
jgi:hypothetical protein